MAPSGGNPYLSPPSIRSRASFPFFCFTKRILGLLFTATLLILLLLGSPIFLLLRITGYVKRKSRRWRFEQHCCTHHWPLSGDEPDVAGVIVNGEIDSSRLNEFINKADFCDRNGLYSSIDDLSGEIVKMWSQSYRCLQNDADLLSILNEQLTFPKRGCSVNVANGFNYLEKSTISTVLLLSSAAHNKNMCVCRLKCILSNQRMYLEMEPQPSYHFLHPAERPTLMHNAICLSIKFAIEGPSSLLALSLRDKSPLWEFLEGKEKHTTRNRRRLKVLTHRNSSSVLMDSAPENVIVESKEGLSHLHRGSSLLRKIPTHRRCWTSVPNPDLVGRTEKLLRATTCELMMALLAGALRSHFREQGVMHPPDLGIAVPTSVRSFLPISTKRVCDTILLPLLLPTSVEGAIPRLWAVQKRLSKIMHGSVPSALKITQIIARACLPSFLAQRIFRHIYGSHSIYVAFYRSGGELKLASNVSIQSLLMFPSLSSNIRASFIFLQYGKEIKLCASLCKMTFPDAQGLLKTFERETNRLLDHLSLRLLSLPQSTFLPSLPPFLTHERTENEVDSQMFGSEYLNRKMSEIEENVEKDYSLEELYRLLSTVQCELDGMKANPQGDRSEYIRKLSALERRMQRFHECITSKLGAEAIDTQSISIGDESCDAVANVLAPYREEAGASGSRRFSREFSRTESSANRKSSRSSF